MNFFKKWRYVIAVLLVAFLGLIFSPSKFTQPIKNIFWQVAEPFGYASRNTLGKAFPFLKDIFHLKTIINENSNLTSENLDLQSRLAKLTETEYENEILKKELGFMKNQDINKTIAAAIIGQSSGYLKTLTLDKGATSGINEGDAVISQGLLVGTLTQVRADNSEITLITDFNSLVPVVLENSRGTGLLRGGLGGLSIEDIPLNIQVQKDENVLTSGLGGQIPAGILIGKVSSVISKEGEIFQKATVISPVDFSKLEVLFVIKQQ
ncbi:MAG: rod shape-determining protein MreC [Candidatus Berkelbacteria bacterium]|nr:rod shape-determining protein MreC [Candidatus Berkelbacteria bacterium]